MHLFPVGEPVGHVVMGMVGHLTKTVQNNRYIHVITNRYSKLARAIPTLKTTAAHATNVFVDHRLIKYEIFSYLLTGNGTHSVRNNVRTARIRAPSDHSVPSISKQPSRAIQHEHRYPPLTLRSQTSKGFKNHRSAVNIRLQYSSAPLDKANTFESLPCLTSPRLTLLKSGSTLHTDGNAKTSPQGLYS